jgi:hypothetical protein
MGTDHALLSPQSFLFSFGGRFCDDRAAADESKIQQRSPIDNAMLVFPIYFTVRRTVRLFTVNLTVSVNFRRNDV